MVKKVKKLSKMDKNEKEKDPNKFRLGRNMGTFLILIGSIIFLFFAIYIPSSYISVGNKGNVTPFVSGSTPVAELDEKVKRMDGKDFDLFDINFTATDYNTIDKTEIKFSIKFTWTEKTSELCEYFNPYSSTNNIKAYVCLASDWVGFTAYGTILNCKLTNATNGNTTTKTTTVSDSNNTFPKKANTFPIKVKVDAPDAYLYLYFTYNKNGKVIENSYILKYEYNEYHTDSTKGGIPA